MFMFTERLRGVNVEDEERNIPQFLAVFLPKSAFDFPGNDSVDAENRHHAG